MVKYFVLEQRHKTSTRIASGKPSQRQKRIVLQKKRREPQSPRRHLHKSNFPPLKSSLIPRHGYLIMNYSTTILPNPNSATCIVLPLVEPLPG